ncbi:ethanolamine ammonia-lyase subunit EutC [Pseudooceanicola sp. CBS1P-1]|uniref:Ethanolamine ammonia-lyase small subunit n=1 Tax=Pseudooceanicola albus TaxID=2692189 RepID=A0A6L7G7T6_9RHOB|nr:MULTISPECIES: ethanolamine ammonia-lyase subunit EutC [Pseudooceanicola]MBT9385971.1 ethanolamine ammonia-lyase subunit EutC [Pseudooceanicola endophyticus]MXN19608.1 ethanolamine ammonia-lyase subunit EutC [Pseudooceanicola albus]
MSPRALSERLRAMTEARVMLGRAGGGMPTRAVLDFALDHARAREAVWSEMDLPALRAALAGYPLAEVVSAAGDRETHVRRPDLGRQLAAGTRLALPPSDLVIVVADGLSAMAVDAHAAQVVHALQALRETAAPVVLARQARVALGDQIAARAGARAVVVLIGERPGLSAADSLGAYVTWAPEPGLPDSRRNCLSNIRSGGLDPQEAAHRIAALLAQMAREGTSGVGLKREPPLPGQSARALPGGAER